MSNQNKHINHKSVSWERFQSYLSNVIPGKEKNAFEKDVMQNPFENDALEGFEMFASASIENDLSDLNARIQRKSGYYPKVNIWESRKILNIAASIFLVAMFGIVVIFMTRKTKTIVEPQLSENLSPTVFKDSNLQINSASELITQSSDFNVSPNTDNELEVEAITKDPEVKVESREMPRKTVTKTTKQDSDLLLVSLAPKEISKDVLNDVQKSEILPTQKMTIETEKKDTLITVKPPETSTMESAVAAKPPVEYNAYINEIKKAVISEFPEASGDFEIWFYVNEEGQLENFDVVKSISRRIDKKIITAINDQGNWIPAYKSSKPISSMSVIQISFTEK